MQARRFLTRSASACLFGLSVQATIPKSKDPPFSLTGSRYDQSQFSGRLQSMFELINPATLLISDQEVARCQSLLKQFANGNRGGLTDGQLWDAKATVDAVIHPASGEKMFAPGRMSAFLPMNIPICAGMLMHGPTSIYAQAFWQWINQSYNVVNNYTNRAGREIEMGPLMQSYGLAVGTSIGIAMGAGKLIGTYPALARFGPFVPYLAVITAGSCNLGFTRSDEIKNGIPVMDEDCNPLGVSRKAGTQAVIQTITTRTMFLNIFPLLLPPIAMGFLNKTPAFKASRGLRIVTELSIIAGCFAVALPAALAIQPQRMKLSVSALEPEFQNLKDKNGKKIEFVYGNKGL